MSGAGIAGRIDAGSSVESIDKEARIVGEAVISVFVADIACLQGGVSLKGVGGLWNILAASDVGE